MGDLTTQPPTKEQLDRIRQVAGVVLGDPDRLFQHVGHPETRWEASRMLGALHKIRNQQPGTSFEEKTLISQIEEAADARSPIQEEPPMPETKTCSSCGEDKALDQFGKNKSTPTGLSYTCLDCNRERTRRNKAKKRKAARAGEAEIETPVVEATSSMNGYVEHFHNPTLLQLRLLSQFLGGATLDATAAVCEAIAGFEA